MRTKYLIIGNSAGGIGATEAIRQVDKEDPVVIVSDGPYPACSRPLISKYLAGEGTLNGMLFRTPEFYQNKNIVYLLGEKVGGLERPLEPPKAAMVEEMANKMAGV